MKMTVTLCGLTFAHIATHCSGLASHYKPIEEILSKPTIEIEGFKKGKYTPSPGAIMFFDKYLIPVESPESWAEKYSLEIRESECRECGETLRTEIPFASAEYRGLFSGKCSCGNEKTPFVFVVMDSEAQNPSRQSLKQNFS